MCGIAGIITRNKNLISRQRLDKGISCMKHRGPESSVTWLNEDQTVSLAHNRLSIIDLNPRSAQPFHYSDRYTIVHNGEVYNYLELKEQLLNKGFHFTTASDTEVIIAAFQAWGTGCVTHFDGMFAFAIWDEKEKKLFAARDRMGEKPFFFFYDEEQLLFASEQKFFWNSGIEKQINRSMLYNFLTIGYTTNPTDPQETFYSNIYKLPAASWLQYDLSDHSLKIENYWQVDLDLKNVVNENEAIEKFTQLFNDSIKKRLRSDVSIGTSLSGGLDSSSIVSICDELKTGQYSHKCFSASFKGFEKDELRFAKLVAEKYGLEHHVVEIDENNLVKLMQDVMQHQDEPFGSASVLAQYKVFEAAKNNGVTVLLDGQGADEILGGYHKYYKWYWQELYREGRLKGSREFEKAMELGIGEKFSFANKMAAKLPEFAASILQTRKSKQAYRNQDLNREFAFENKRNLYYSLPTSFDLNGALYFNSFISGLEELLRLADRNSMAHSTELRLPFLSHELVEFIFSLPSHYKINQGWTKWILRKSIETKLPNEIVWRKDKIGFEPPQKSWMERPEVSAAITEGKNKLVNEYILDPSTLKINKPHSAYAAHTQNWKYWSASFLF